MFVLLSTEERPLRAGDACTVSHEQALNFRYGIYSRRTCWRLPAANGTLTVKAERFAHIEDVHLLCMRYTISSDVPCRVGMKTGINSVVRDLNGPHVGKFNLVKTTKQGRGGHSRVFPVKHWNKIYRWLCSPQ